MHKHSLKIAVVGATGNVGRALLRILAERDFNPDHVIALASENSVGKKISCGEEKILTVKSLATFNFKDCDVAFFAAGSKISKEYAVKASKDCLVIDNASVFRTDEVIPLIVPEVNPNDIPATPTGLITNPNCAIIPICVALKPLHDIAIVERVIVSTYQSVSGAGKKAMDELDLQTKSLFTANPVPAQAFTRPIAFNVIPQIDTFLDSGYTGEEQKMRQEIKKILDDDIELSATCVRVPTFIGHCAAVHVEFSKKMSIEQIVTSWKKTPGLQFMANNEDFSTTLDAANQDDIFISRLRQDVTYPNGIVFWIASDNMRKGAALNAIQILESWLEKTKRLSVAS